jgi:hypothetical protein
MLASQAGRPGPRPPSRGRLWPLLLAILALAVGGCAQPGTGVSRAAAAATSTPPATVTVGPADGGRTVDLTVGDRLLVQLTTTKAPSRLQPAWVLRSLPSTVLRRIQGSPNATQATLVADRPGTVRLVLVKRFGCEPPRRCPVARPPDSQSERMRPPLERPTVTITVRVR